MGVVNSVGVAVFLVSVINPAPSMVMVWLGEVRSCTKGSLSSGTKVDKGSIHVLALIWARVSVVLL